MKHEEAARPLGRAVVAVVATVDVVMWWIAVRTGFYLPGLGMDFATYRDAANRWLSGGPFFHPYQFAAYDTFAASPQPILYPPTTIPLFAAFTVLPSILWWAIPIGVTAWQLRSIRGWRLVTALLLLAWPNTLIAIWTGNPVMWIVMVASLGLGPLVLLKPTLAPFALVGFQRRRWWVALAGLALATLPFVGMLPDYLRVLTNQRGGDLLYSLWQVPAMLIPLVAWEWALPARSRSVVGVARAG